MVFRKHRRRIDRRFGKRKPIACYKCGTVIKHGISITAK